jgi:sn-glycerol 3-phosphate transport system substrate-binding protein
MMLPSGRDYNAWQVVNTEFLAKRAAMIWTSTAFTRYLEDNAKFPVVAAPLPKLERTSVPTGGTMFVVPRGGSEAWRRAAAAWLKFMSRPTESNAFATATGYIPVTRGGIAELEKSGFYDKHPNDLVAVKQLSSARPWPWSPALFRVQREAVQSRLEAAVLADKDSTESLQDAARAIREEL